MRLWSKAARTDLRAFVCRERERDSTGQKLVKTGQTLVKGGPDRLEGVRLEAE
jgi:hypothetical protein